MKRKLLDAALVLASAAATGLCVSFYLPPAAELFSLCPFLFVLMRRAREMKLRDALRVGIMYFYAYYLVVWHWFLLMYPLDFTGLPRSGALAAVLTAWLGLPLFQAVFAMWQIPLFALAARSRAFYKENGAPRLSAPLLYAAMYAFFEWIQTIGWAGVPWGRLAIGQASVPTMIGGASLFGSYFISFMIVSANGYFALAILNARRGRAVSSALPLTAAGVVIASTLLCGALCVNVADAASSGRTVKIAVLQGNVSSTDKWSDGSYDNLHNIYEGLAARASWDGAELVVVPETAIPVTVNESAEAMEDWESIANDYGVVVIATGYWRRGSVFNNAVFGVDPDTGIDEGSVYAKRHLVPFGEFVPFEEVFSVLIPPLAELDMFGNNVTVGDKYGAIETRFGTVGPMVCFDSIYETSGIGAVASGAEILTVSTNDSWFDGSAAIYQHTAQAVLRAVECGRYVLRAGNTGYSCVIAPTGRITASVPVEERGYAIVEAEMRSTRTLYSVIGNAFVYACGAASFASCAAGAADIYINRRKRRADAPPSGGVD